MMRADNQALKLAPLGNILGADYNQKARGTKVTIGVDGNIVGDILNGKFVGGLILVDKVEFERVKKEMEQDKPAGSEGN
jgi:hypothetical protein